MPTKAELEAQLAAQDREEVRWSAAYAVPLITVGVLLFVALLWQVNVRYGAGGFSPWVMALPGLVAWLIASSEVRGYFSPRIYGHGPLEAGQVLAAAVGATATWWEVWTAQAGGPGATWPWLVQGALYGTALWWALLWWAGRREKPVEPVVLGDANVDTLMPWPRLVAKATRDEGVITTVKPHRAGVTLTIEPARVVDEDGDEDDVDFTLDDLTGAVSNFATLAAKEYRRRTGQSMPVNCARTEPGRDDAEYLLHVTMRDVFTEHTRYVPRQGPQTIYDPIDLGEFETGDRIELTLAHQHGKYVGHSGAGKSVVANNTMARITECRDAVVWVGATDKLIPLIWPWLRSWFAGLAVTPVLDYVAGQDVGELLKMLRAAYRLTCERNAENTDESKIKCTQAQPHVFVFIEEMSHAVEFSESITTHDGIEADVSMLVKLLVRAGRSAGVSVVIMSQTALASSGGDEYAEIIRNIQIRVCLRTLRSYDGYETIPALNNVDTTQIPLYTMIVQPSIEQARALPGKAPELDGTATIDPIAIQNATWKPSIESDVDLGPDYRDRWDPARLPELAKAVRKHGFEWRVPTPGVRPSTVGVDNQTGAEGGDEVQVQVQWTERDDEALAATLEAGLDDGPAQREVGGFNFPNGDKELARMRELAAELARDYPEEDDEDLPPVPPPLDAVLDWFDDEEDAGRLAPFYLTEQIAAGIGHENPRRLGAEINLVVGFRSKNAPRSIDPGQRKGWLVRDLREWEVRRDK